MHFPCGGWREAAWGGERLAARAEQPGGPPRVLVAQGTDEGVVFPSDQESGNSGTADGGPRCAASPVCVPRPPPLLCVPRRARSLRSDGRRTLPFARACATDALCPLFPAHLAADPGLVSHHAWLRPRATPQA